MRTVDPSIPALYSEAQELCRTTNRVHTQRTRVYELKLGDDGQVWAQIHTHFPDDEGKTIQDTPWCKVWSLQIFDANEEVTYE